MTVISHSAVNYDDRPIDTQPDDDDQGGDEHEPIRSESPTNVNVMGLSSRATHKGNDGLPFRESDQVKESSDI